MSKKQSPENNLTPKVILARVKAGQTEYRRCSPHCGSDPKLRHMDKRELHQQDVGELADVETDCARCVSLDVCQADIYHWPWI